MDWITCTIIGVALVVVLAAMAQIPRIQAYEATCAELYDGTLVDLSSRSSICVLPDGTISMDYHK